MKPFIQDGDILTLRRLEKTVKQGEVFAFPHPRTGKLVIHRLVQCRGGLLLMKGDLSALPDGWIPPERVLAQVIRVERACKDLRPAHRVVRRLIVLISTGAGLRFCRYSIYKRMVKFGEFY